MSEPRHSPHYRKMLATGQGAGLSQDEVDALYRQSAAADSSSHKNEPPGFIL